MSGPPCASLTLAPQVLALAQVLTITGWAPLTEVIGQPFGYDLVLEIPGKSDLLLTHVGQQQDDDLHASLRMPTSIGGQRLRPGAYRVALRTPMRPGQFGESPLFVAHGALTLRSGVSWAALSRLHPLAWQADGAALSPAWTVPGAPLGHLAYCTQGGVRVSSDGGAR